ncbi:MAG: hypothetical protein J6R47_05605 [Acholeplasmatales bacterium]|nr:hypothetical protein [Acholeplasmatales bacterium]
MTDSLIKFLKNHKEELNKAKLDYTTLMDAIYEELNNEDTVDLIMTLSMKRPKDPIEFYRHGKLTVAVNNAFMLWDQAKRFPVSYEVHEFIDFWIKNDLGFPDKEIIEVIKDVYKDWSNKFSYLEFSTGEDVIRRND